MSSLPKTCSAAPFQSPLPWSNPGLGQHQELFHVWHPESQFPTAWAKIYCLSGLYSPIHACWPWFRLKSTKMSTQPFTSFHRKSSYLSTSSHLRSWWGRYAAVFLSHVQLSAAPGTAACQAPVHANRWLTLLSSLRPHSTSPSSCARKLHSSPSSCSPKARVSIETKVEYAAGFQESRQENISVRDETKIMRQQRHSEEKDSRKKPLEIKVWGKKRNQGVYAPCVPTADWSFCIAGPQCTKTVWIYYSWRGQLSML